MITASKSALGLLCAWWAKPGVTLPRTESSAAATLGTEFHGAAQAAIDGRDVGELSREALALYRAWSAWWVRNRVYDWRAEVAYVLDPIGRTASLSGVKSRAYAYDPRTVPGTADAVLIEGRVGWLADWKTGYTAPPARDDAQLLTLAAAMRLTHALDEVRASIVHVRPDGISEDTVTLDEFDLDSWVDTLADLVRALPTAEAKPGAHCRALYCPALGVCPATSSALAEVEPAARRLPVVTSVRDIQGPDHAAALYQLVRLAEARIAAVKAAVREYADAHGGVPVGDKVWQRVVRSRDAIDLEVPGAFEALKASLGERAVEAVSYSTTKTALEHVAREVARESGRPIKHVVGEALAALRDAGAIKQSQSVTYEER